MVTSGNCSSRRVHRITHGREVAPVVPEGSGDGGPGVSFSRCLCHLERLIRGTFTQLGRFHNVTAHFRGLTHGCGSVLFLTYLFV